MSLLKEPHKIQVDLIRQDGTYALAGHYLAEMSPDTHVFTVREHFVSSDRQHLPLAGTGDLRPVKVISTAHAPLVEAALDDVEVVHQLSYEDLTPNPRKWLVT